MNRKYIDVGNEEDSKALNSASSKQLLHFAQIQDRRRFQKFDYVNEDDDLNDFNALKVKTEMKKAAL